MKILVQISEYYSRLRIAGMHETEIDVLKHTVVETARINNLDSLKLLQDCVLKFEEMQKVKSDEIESKIIKSELRQRGIEVD